MIRLRVAVLNVQSGVGTTAGWWSYVATLGDRTFPRRTHHIERIGEGLQRERVDLAIFTEVDGGSTRTGGVDQGALLASRGGWSSHVFFPCLRIARRVCQGNAIAACAPLSAVTNHRLSGLGEPRYLSEAVVTFTDVRVHVFAAHTSLKAAVRRKQLVEIRDIVGARNGPVLLGGDFNARRSSELDDLSRKLRRTGNAPTFPSWRPRWALDELFVSSHFQGATARVLRELRESDHLPVIVDVVLQT